MDDDAVKKKVSELIDSRPDWRFWVAFLVCVKSLINERSTHQEIEQFFANEVQKYCSEHETSEPEIYEQMFYFVWTWEMGNHINVIAHLENKLTSLGRMTLVNSLKAASQIL